MGNMAAACRADDLGCIPSNVFGSNERNGEIAIPHGVITQRCNLLRDNVLYHGESRQVPRLLEYTDISCDLHIDGVPVELGAILLKERGYNSTSLDVVGPWDSHRNDGVQYFRTGGGMLLVTLCELHPDVRSVFVVVVIVDAISVQASIGSRPARVAPTTQTFQEMTSGSVTLSAEQLIDDKGATAGAMYLPDALSCSGKGTRPGPCVVDLCIVDLSEVVDGNVKVVLAFHRTRGGGWHVEALDRCYHIFPARTAATLDSFWQLHSSLEGLSGVPDIGMRLSERPPVMLGESGPSDCVCRMPGNCSVCASALHQHRRKPVRWTPKSLNAAQNANQGVSLVL